MASENCDRCKKKADIFLSYGPHSLCQKHFMSFFEKRVRRTIRLNSLIKSKEHIAVAYSGGKDSTVLLSLLNRVFSKTSQLTAIIIDEGIPGYRDNAIRIAEKNCKSWNIPYETVSMKKETGFQMTEIIKKLKSSGRALGSPCAFCGVLCRKILNEKAVEIGADKLATGHNLDDEVQSIAMNFFDNKLDQFVRLGPIVKSSSKKFVPRIKPLYETPEQEVKFYANSAGLNYYSINACPLRSEAKRSYYRQMIDAAEQEFPGTKYSILRFFERTKPVLEKQFKKAQLKECKKCGAPSSQEICGSCRQLSVLQSL